MKILRNHLVQFLEALRAEGSFVAHDVDYPVDLHPLVVTPITAYLQTNPSTLTSLITVINQNTSIYFDLGKEWAGTITFANLHSKMDSLSEDELWEVIGAILYFIYSLKYVRKALKDDVMFSEFANAQLQLL